MTTEETEQLNEAITKAEDARLISDPQECLACLLKAIRLLAAETLRLRKEDDDLRKLL